MTKMLVDKKGLRASQHFSYEEDGEGFTPAARPNEQIRDYETTSEWC